ncbi:MAG: ABC transporter permease subunit [Kiloniellales bacterium]
MGGRHDSAAALALSLALLGSAPTGTLGADPLAVVVVSLASLSIFLVPLIALLLSFDAVVGEAERGTLLLLLAYPLARWQIVVGKFLGHAAILALAIVLGYGVVAVALLAKETTVEAWSAFALLIASSILLGAAFLALGALSSVVVRERATAAGLAVALWLLFVLIYDSALLGLLVADQGRMMTPPVLDALLLLNPADAYRLLNLAGDEAVATLAGMAGPGEAGRLPRGLLLASLTGWIVVPLGLAIIVFARRQP